MTSHVALLLFVTMSLFVTPCLSAQCETLLLPSGGASNDLLGRAVDISGFVAVAGAPFDDDNGSASGSAVAFRWDGANWNEEQVLLATDGVNGDKLGISVAVEGDLVVLGANGDDDMGPGSGSAYVFRYTGGGWVQEGKLTASDGQAQDCFGRSVAVDGNVVVVGADDDDDQGNLSGSAYVFRFDGASWVEEQKLLPLDGTAGAFFGRSVSVQGDAVVVGAWSDDTNAPDEGSAYVFRFDGLGWVEEQKITPADGAEDDYFGHSVSLSDDTVVVGARGHWPGVAYVYRHDGTTWMEEQVIPSPEGGSIYFAFDVDIDGSRIIVGAPYLDDNGPVSGGAFVFEFDGTSWSQTERLVASDGSSIDWFGYTVGIGPEYSVVGAHNHDDNGLDAGAAYIYGGTCDRFIRGDCDGDGAFNGLTDGLVALTFQFVPGSPAPPCLTACDADGDDVFNGLSDGLRILNFQFFPGSPPPAAPYPDCGNDSNTRIVCEEPPADCIP